jgi:dihydroneopterin aldolase
MDKIFIEGLSVDAIIGIYPVERTKKQAVIFDIEMKCDTTQASASDNIKYALDYHKVCQDIFEFVQSSSYQLIETLADAVANRILKHEHVQSVKIKLSKPEALELAKNVGIEIIRKKS